MYVYMLLIFVMFWLSEYETVVFYEKKRMIKEAIKPWFTDFYRVLDPVTEKLVEICQSSKIFPL